MTTYRVQTSLHDVSELPRDQYVNTIHVTFPVDATDAELGDVALDTGAFYGDIQQYFSTAIHNGSTHTVKIYRVGAPLGTPPLVVHPFAFAPPGGTIPLPNEVALCATFHADPQPGVIRQSWRGRIYLGPFNSGMLGTGIGGGRPDATNVADLRLKTNVWLQNLYETGACKPSIYSRKLGRVYPIKRVAFDDAWDTQRSRGLRASSAPSVDVPGGGGLGGPV